jgi:cytochrome c oxidase assembly protein subunit 15
MRRYAWITLLFTLGVILWGAYVRATGSGAGCGDHWPLCNGQVVPRDATAATFIEFTHRVTSGLSLLAVVGLLVGTFRAFPKKHAARSGAVASMVFMLLEAAVGAGLVLLKLVAQDSSALRAVVLGIHLINTFLLVAAMTYTALAMGKKQVSQPLRWSMLDLGLLAALMAVGVTGAITALGDTLFPSRTLTEGLAADLDPLSHFLIRLRIVHPALAMLTTLAAFYRWLRVEKHSARADRWGVIFIAGIGSQLALGFLNVALLAPVWLQLVHLALADVVWLAAIAWMSLRPEVKPLGRRRIGARVSTA